MKLITLLTLTQISFFYPTNAKAEKPKVIDIDEEYRFNDPWFKKDKTDDENFNFLLKAIAKSPSGKAIIEKAEAKAMTMGHKLNELLAVGDGSLTDTTLVRRFQASDPTNVNYETRSKVYINRHLKTLDAMLDLSHELTHFSFREPFNPYDHRFSLRDFIKSTVEGKGGEVDAYLVECKVLQELLPGEVGTRSSCTKVYDKKTGIISKDKGIEEFYKVGAHYKSLVKDFDKFALDQNEIPKLSGDEAIFISSAWGLPYPVAAVREYQNIMDKVCKNDSNRISMIQATIGRTPASENSNAQQLRFKSMYEDYKIRCHMFNKNY